MYLSRMLSLSSLNQHRCFRCHTGSSDLLTSQFCKTMNIKINCREQPYQISHTRCKRTLQVPFTISVSSYVQAFFLINHQFFLEYGNIYSSYITKMTFSAITKTIYTKGQIDLHNYYSLLNTLKQLKSSWPTLKDKYAKTFYTST